MRTYSAKPGENEPRWYIVDVEGKPLGRMATEIARILQGKHKPEYTPHVDCGDCIVVVNAEKVRVTGRKAEQKTYDHYTYYPGGRKVVPVERVMREHPERVIKLAVRRMLPKTTLGRQMLKKLKVFRDGNHPHQAQQPEPLEL